MSYKHDSPVFMGLLWMHSDLADGILCPWMPLSCRILTRLIERRCWHCFLRIKRNFDPLPLLMKTSFDLCRLSLSPIVRHSRNKMSNYVRAASRSSI